MFKLFYLLKLYVQVVCFWFYFILELFTLFYIFIYIFLINFLFYNKFATSEVLDENVNLFYCC